MLIDSYADCQSAQIILSKVWGGSDTCSGCPKGCNLHVTGRYNNSVYFNYHPTGSPQASAKPICKASASLIGKNGQAYVAENQPWKQ